MKNSLQSKKILMSGNEAMAEAAIRAGCDFYAGYPITPQNELIAYMAREMPRHKKIFIQAESELAAINMLFGASASGRRVMTSSSSPGISLKQEGISYLAGAELPAVIINVMRGGPGLGNIASGQSDYFQATRGGGHGDYFTPCFSPWSVEEAVELVKSAFDLADYYRNPALVLTDAMVGQMMEPVDLNVKSFFNKTLYPKNWALTGSINREPRVIKSFFLKEGLLKIHNDALNKKWQEIREREQRASFYETEDARYLLVAYGSQSRIAKDSLFLLRKDGIKIGLFRPISLWPFPEKSLKSITGAGPKRSSYIKKIFVVEQSLGQMVEDVRLALPDKKIYFLGKAGG
ncbi:MAG: 3-methyl-2-oxobutanoate dehydrogenase subunit VorB, partial [Candidatus Omnitrophica bacterium]|nr:3-methyl-2-oxobutanoate dehydrogenase subunit VorB [Candidatus Omnitrophota bacterium]